MTCHFVFIELFFLDFLTLIGKKSYCILVSSFMLSKKAYIYLTRSSRLKKVIKLDAPSVAETPLCPCQ